MPKVVEAATVEQRARTTRLYLARPKQRPGNFLWPFLLLLGLYCGWVFSLPLFPTQDDSLHLYYVDVIRHLLAGDSRFEAFFFLRHPPPPYVVHYALLYALTGFLKPVVAEKCVVCLILVLTALGFRYLSTALGAYGGLMSLWAIPFALSWPLFMGFHNYCLSLSFSLWAWGLWLRARRRRKPVLWFAFLLAVLLILFTHPVPLMFLLFVTGADLVVRIPQEKLRWKSSWMATLARFKWDLAIAAAACSSLCYIALFVDKASTAHDLTAHVSRWEVTTQFLRLRWMCFAVGGLFLQAYRGVLCLILLFGFVLASRGLRERFRMCCLGASDVVLFCAVTLALALPLLPTGMNGSDHFSNRLQLLVWIAVLAAAGAGSGLTARFRKGIAIGACLFALVTLGIANRFIRPVARNLALIENAPVAPHQLGLSFDAPVRFVDRRLTFDPYLRWEGGRYFRRAGAVLLNDPWAGPPFPLPVWRRPSRFTARLSALDFDDPMVLHQRLMSSSALRAQLLPAIDLLLFFGKPPNGAAAPDPLVELDSSHRWNCHAKLWYSVCEAEPKAGSGPVPVLSSAAVARTHPATGR